MKKQLFIITILIVTFLFGQNFPQKTYEPQKLENAPKIDGVIDDAIWNDHDILTNFIQFYPENGKTPKFETEVKIFYTNKSIFVAAQMFDPHPDSINVELGVRDSDQGPNADLFAVHICPYNDNINSTGFMVSASGVQTDMTYSLSDEDHNWDAIWKSEVKINEKGWAAELEIPYSALRFPQKDVQTWGINFYRLIKRYNEWSTWSFLDVENQVFWTNPGQLLNLKNIDPPLRLSFIPYLSTYLENNTDGDWGTIYNGGLDLKYGINESFTLDMTLIPDFKQTQSDNVVLNLSPFEMAYDEKRQFFIEGMDLFNKGNIFYTRRVGGRPHGYDDVEDNLQDNEKVIDNPDKAPLINSTKISGRTKHGLGIGVFNGLTDDIYATVKDTLTGKKRQVKTQDMTNYNMVVLDQTLPNNSYISIANTNMYKNDYMSDVLATEFEFKNKNNTYGIEGHAAVSNQFFEDSTAHGHRYSIEAGKIKGKYQYEYELNVESDTYNPNDMGYIQQNNEVDHVVSFDRNIHTPTRFFIENYQSLSMIYVGLYNPSKFVNFIIEQTFSGTFKNYNSYHYHLFWQPMESNDFFEARQEGKKFIRPAKFHFCNNFSTAQQNRFQYGVFWAYNFNYSKDHNYPSFGIDFNPRFRINNKASIEYDFYYWINKNERGFVEQLEDDFIVFGERTTTEMTHTLAAKYTLNNKSNLDFRLRHYFSNADYSRYLLLNDDGYLEASIDYCENADINYNAFNIDMVYSWEFAPGSFLNLVWKNSIYNDIDKVYYRWYDNFDHTISAPQTNSFSVKLLYYFDYAEFR